jgi:hypothetical protein
MFWQSLKISFAPRGGPICFSNWFIKGDHRYPVPEPHLEKKKFLAVLLVPLDIDSQPPFRPPTRWNTTHSLSCCCFFFFWNHPRIVFHVISNNITQSNLKRTHWQFQAQFMLLLGVTHLPMVLDMLGQRKRQILGFFFNAPSPEVSLSVCCTLRLSLCIS